MIWMGKYEGVPRVPGTALFLDLDGGYKDVPVKIIHTFVCCVCVLFYSKKVSFVCLFFNLPWNISLLYNPQGLCFVVLRTQKPSV